MALRVYDLAKELKISSAALMKHLNDMGVEVKSHMKYLEDDVSEKVRQKFKQEVEQLKRLETERRLIQEQLRNKEKHDKDNKSSEALNPFKDVKIKKEPEVVTSPFEKQETKEPQTKNYPAKERQYHDRQANESRHSDRQQSDNRYSDRNDYQSRQKPPYAERNTGSDSSDRPNRDRNYQQRPPRQNYDNNSDRPNTQRSDNQSQQSRSNYRSRQDGTTGYRGDRPQGERSQGDNRSGYNRGERPQGDNRSGYNRGERPQGDNRQGYNRSERPQGERSQGDNRTGYNRGDRPQGDNRQGYNRGERPQGEQRTYQGSDKRGTYDDRNRKPREQRTGDNRYKDKSDSDGRSYAPRTAPRVTFPKAGIVKPEIPEVPKEKVFGKKKIVAIDELGDKSKHLQAKLKNTKKRKKGEAVVEIDEVAIEKNIKQTLAGSKKKKKYKKEEKKNVMIDEISEINISEFTSVSELAKIIDVSPSEIITKFFQMGKMVSINQRLDKDSLELICSEFELDICFKDEFGTDMLQDKIDVMDDVVEKSRPPVVTIMGHVDHGKTSILDRIRNTKVVAGESGGITQHVGAYQAIHNNHKITFIDTPGHEAFTAMRARGANITDIAVIVVAANDGVKPQTVEAIDHAKAAGVTMVVAINKIDLPEANVDKTIASLLEQNVFLEGYGGQISYTTCSAITGEGIDDLLELILLSAEMKELKARFNGPGKGIVIESEKNSRMGAKATVLLQEGTLKKGDNIVVGSCYGHVRKLENERAVELQKIYPADIAVVYGLNDVPKAGDIINVVENEKIARQIGGERLLIRQEREKYQSKTNLGNLFTKIKQNEMTELRLIIKADVDGSVEAVCDSLQKLSTDEIKINIIRKSVGGIIEADVDLASASDAIIIGFNVRANNKAKKLSEDSGVEIKFYQIIYDAIEDIKKAMIGMLSPEFKEKILGSALVKQIFKIKKVGTIAGCAVEKGHIKSKSKVRLFRDEKVIFTGDMDTLKHYNENVNEVKSGTECGISIKNYNDLKEGDIIECFIMEEVERQL